MPFVPACTDSATVCYPSVTCSPSCSPSGAHTTNAFSSFRTTPTAVNLGCFVNNLCPFSLLHFPRRLAVLNAIRGHPIPTITISGSIPTTVAVADAMADACSHLQKLTIVYPPWYNDLPPENGGDVGANAYAAGVVQLLTVVGPRLREMRVTRSAPHWTAEAYEALRHCTGLTSLTLEAGRCAMAEERDLSKS